MDNVQWTLTIYDLIADMISSFPFTSPHKPHRLVDWSIVLVLIPTHGTPAPSQPGQPAANANNFIKIHRHRNNENIKCCIIVERQNMKYKQNGKKHSSRHDYTHFSVPPGCRRLLASGGCLLRSFILLWLSGARQGGVAWWRWRSVENI